MSSPPNALPRSLTARNNGRGAYVNGTLVTILEAYWQAGFRYYVDDKGVTHREQDLDFLAAKSQESSQCN